jgi:hypothetical protein
VRWRSTPLLRDALLEDRETRCHQSEEEQHRQDVDSPSAAGAVTADAGVQEVTSRAGEVDPIGDHFSVAARQPPGRALPGWRHRGTVNPGAGIGDGGELAASPQLGG